MEKLKIALLQVAPCDTLAENLEKGLHSCRRAKELGADIALFPEMWSNGYRLLGRPVEEWKAEAISADSEFIRHFEALARETEVHGNAYRRPKKYGILTESSVCAPFIREDRRE